MSESKVVLNLRSKLEGKEEAGEVVPSGRASLAIDFGDAQTKWSLDYRKPDSLVLRIEGRARLLKTENLKLTGGGDITRDFFEKSTSLDGVLEFEFDKNVEVEISGSSGPDGSRVGLGLQVRF